MVRKRSRVQASSTAQKGRVQALPFLHSDLKQSPPPKPSLFEQKCRIAEAFPRGSLKRMEHFASSGYSVQSNPVHFNSSSCIRFRRRAAQSQNGLRAHYEQVRITLYIFTGNFDFKSKSKQSTKLLFQYKISRFS